MDNKILSLVVPAYNSARYIGKCLESVKELLDSSLEVIVIDDGSSDKTSEIVESQIKKDNRIRLIRVENGGVSKARNLGMDNASGKYIMFLDADDYFYSETFEIVKQIVVEDRYDFTAFSRKILERNGKLWQQDFPFDSKREDNKAAIDRIMYADSLFNECWGKLFRKEIIDKFGIRFPVDIPVGEDLMFVMEYYSHCSRSVALNYPLVVYRQHGDSAMRRFSVENRMKYSKYIYDYSKKYLPAELEKEVSFYNFKVITNICREYSADRVNVSTIRYIYNFEMTRNVLCELDKGYVPIIRKHEYFLMENRLCILSALYYFFKAKF